MTSRLCVDPRRGDQTRRGNRVFCWGKIAALGAAPGRRENLGKRSGQSPAKGAKHAPGEALFASRQTAPIFLTGLEMAPRGSKVPEFPSSRVPEAFLKRPSATA